MPSHAAENNVCLTLITHARSLCCSCTHVAVHNCSCRHNCTCSCRYSRSCSCKHERVIDTTAAHLQLLDHAPLGSLQALQLRAVPALNNTQQQHQQPLHRKRDKGQRHGATNPVQMLLVAVVAKRLPLHLRQWQDMQLSGCSPASVLCPVTSDTNSQIESHC